MNGFPDVKIKSFQLPSDAPQGGINVELGTVLKSPSPIGVQLGTIQMAVGYSGVNLGLVSAQGITLQKGDNEIVLKGVLKQQTDPAALEKIGVLFSNYIAGKMSNTTATGLSCAPNGVDPVNWLSDGFKSVELNVALAAPEPLKIINAVSMGYLDLQFSQGAPYAPIATAPAVIADFSIPFGFSLNITDVAQNISLGTNKTDFAVIQVPLVPAQSNQQTGKLQFAMTNNSITALPGKESEFNDYTYALTSKDLYTFSVSGNATTKTQTPIGPITLSGITFKVPTSLHGLQFLNSTPTVINSLDVVGGTEQNLQLGINVSMTNPSDFSIATGDVNFAMVADGDRLGTVMLKNLNLVRGFNTVMASAEFNPKGSKTGQNLLSTFVMGKNNAVDIAGFDGSTSIISLLGGLKEVSISSTLPGLQSQLIQRSSLTVLPDSVTTKVVQVKVNIANPFSAGLTITKVVSAVTYDGMPVGNINQDISSNPIVIPGHGAVDSPPLNMEMNLQPAVVALLMRELAVKSNLDTHALDALLGMGGFHIQGQQDVAPDSNLFAGFNISNFVMEAMKSLKVDLQLESALTIGQYKNNLQFAQSNVATATDDTVTRLIPIVGQPIVQQIVEGAKLAFDSIVLSAPTDSSFKVQMKGSITNTGPMAAQISFPQPLTVAWQGKEIGKVTMQTIQAQPNVGAQFDVSGDFSITDGAHMTKFAAYMINNDDFVWDIYTKSVSVNALGFQFNNINMEKFVTLTGAKGFKDCVQINSFNLPANDPAGGIQLTAQTTIRNPSQVGFDLNGVGFDAFFNDVYLGPLASKGMASFPPGGTANMEMQGRLVPQTSQKGLEAVTQVFENFLNAKSSTTTVKGASGSGPNGQVSWLTNAFKTLSIENVVLPGPKEKPTLIPAITMKNMQLDFTKDPYAPPTGSKQVEAQLKNPFGFPLGVSSLNMDVTATYNGQPVANLKIPDSKASTSPQGVVTTAFSDVPFKVFDQSRPIFDAFVKLLTSQANVGFGLKGVSNAVAETAVGTLKLPGIGFDVPTSLAGFDNFGGKNEILSLTVVGGTAQYIEVALKIAFNNPSQISIKVGDINFDTTMNEFNANIGTVFLKDVTIVPGQNTFDAVMHMQSTNLPALSKMLTYYLTKVNVPLTITGSDKSTGVQSLKGGLSSVKLATSMQGIDGHLIVSTVVTANALEILFSHKATSAVTLHNPLGTKFTILKVEAKVMYTKLAAPFQVGHIDYQLASPVTIPAGGQAVAEGWPLVIDADIGSLLKMVQGPQFVDLQQTVTVIVGDGFLGQMYYAQNDVPTKIEGLGGLGDMLAKMAGNTTTATPTTATPTNATQTTIVNPTTTQQPEPTTTAEPATTEPKPTATSEPATTPTEEHPTQTNPPPTQPTETEQPKPATTTPAAEQKPTDSKSDVPPPPQSSGSANPPVENHIVWPFKL
ncbi:hypothetical protein DFQ28_003660 [Apophysomyces sp. BC1034]|nr:hypothetical protein DFQ30_001815 [Apophysomyces sp. BC1015]KAG0182931.1 hypothetical protein DFQ29_001369 [Apophysomyces sp. BC1021]KAG0193740.1 hypothetical protein DFQ28_003660 [Apophysomyces sp. BC1034]